MSPRPRAAYLLGAVALSALVLPTAVALSALAAVLAVTAVDAYLARRTPRVQRSVPRLLSRGIAGPFRLELTGPAPGRTRLRQAAPPDLAVEPAEQEQRLEGTILARRRGRHALPASAVRTDGPLGLGCWFHRPGEAEEILVYPDLHTAYRLATAVRRNRFREAGERIRGPLGLGTEFESIRDYLPDDDFRQINWRATHRLGRPMSNQYRIEQDRDVFCVVDTGRLMAAPLGDRTRLDAAVDAAAAVAAVADVVGDRCGALAFDAKVLRTLEPRRKGARAVIQALFDLEPTSVDSDYELAFHTIRDRKRAFVLVLSDLLEEAAARPLVEAVPLLARRHAIVIASAADTDLGDFVRREPRVSGDVLAAAVALDVLGARARVTAELRRAGAEVVEAPPDRLAAACVGAYLRAKRRARL
jgi:uncharacterized protein (DUF58 family)